MHYGKIRWNRQTLGMCWNNFKDILGVNWTKRHLEASHNSSGVEAVEALKLLSMHPRDVAGNDGLGSHSAVVNHHVHLRYWPHAPDLHVHFYQERRTWIRRTVCLTQSLNREH